MAVLVALVNADELTEQLAEALRAGAYWAGGSPESLAQEFLLPAVLADRRRAVAEALREAADSLPCFCEHAADYGISCPRHGTAHEHFTARPAGRDAEALREAEQRGYRAAVDKSRIFCARSGGCI